MKYQAQAKYDAANTKQIRLKLNTKTDADILKRLESVDNKQGYIKELIRKDIEKKANNTGMKFYVSYKSTGLVREATREEIIAYRQNNKTRWLSLRENEDVLTKVFEIENKVPGMFGVLEVIDD